MREALRVVSRRCPLASASDFPRADLLTVEQFSTASGRVIRDLADLPTDASLLIDALSPISAGSTPTVEDLAASRWATESGVEVLSVDMAWGRGGDDGAFALLSFRELFDARADLRRARDRNRPSAASFPFESHVPRLSGCPSFGSSGSRFGISFESAASRVGRGTRPQSMGAMRRHGLGARDVGQGMVRQCRDGGLAREGDARRGGRKAIGWQS